MKTLNKRASKIVVDYYPASKSLHQHVTDMLSKLERRLGACIFGWNLSPKTKSRVERNSQSNISWTRRSRDLRKNSVIREDISERMHRPRISFRPAESTAGAPPAEGSRGNRKSQGFAVPFKTNSHLKQLVFTNWKVLGNGVYINHCRDKLLNF